MNAVVNEADTASIVRSRIKDSRMTPAGVDGMRI